MNVLQLKICELFNATVWIYFFKPTLKIQKRFATKIHRVACYLDKNRKILRIPIPAKTFGLFLFKSMNLECSL